jgi:N-acetylglucosamine kinase-like BadF-type ATPase
MTESSIGGSSLLLGADGGGTKTIVWLARRRIDQSWEVLGRGRAGTGNPRAAGFDAVQQNLGDAIAAAFADAKLRPQKVAVACFGLAGAGRIAEQAVIADWATSQGLAQQVQVVGDLELVLAAADDDEPGIALIAGTGSVAWGRARSGAVARCGGWGYLLGDEGSGYALGLALLRGVVRALDGRGPATSLVAATQAALGVEEPEEIVARVYASEMTRQRIASLAPLVFASADSDPLASSIVEFAARDLAELVVALTVRLQFGAGDYRLAAAGGLLVNQPTYRERVLNILREKGVHPRDAVIVAEPVRGAVNRAAWLAAANE